MKLKPFREILQMSKEKIDEALAPVRARKVKTQAQLEMAKLDEQLISLEAQIQELCTRSEIDFASLLAKMDQHQLTERRIAQFKQILADLFPME